MEPGLQKLAGELKGRVSIAKIDFDASPDLVEKFGVQGAGTFVLLKDGQEVGRVQTGEVPQVKALLEEKAF